MVSLAFVLALLAPPSGTAEIAGERHRELTRPPAEAAAPAPWVERRELSFAPVEGGVQLRGRWTIRSFGTGWFSGRLFAATPGLRVVSARWGAAPAALKVDDEGGTVAGRVQGSVELTVEAFVPGDPARAALALQLLPAVRGSITAAAPAGLAAALRVDGADSLAIRDRHWSGAQALELSFVTPPAPAADRPPVVVAKVGIGLTVGDADLRGRARAVWEVRQGEISTVELQTAGLGGDLEVIGANVRGFVREGERVRVDLQAPVRDRVELELRWSAPIGRAAETRAGLPTLAPVGVFHSEVALQLARDGEVEAVPDAPGWSYVAAATLPAWAQGLVEGTATAALVQGGSQATGGSLSLLRFVPLEGPPMVVDVAAYTIATSREGRALVRAHYELRNERAAHLRLTPPPGYKVIGVRVGGQTAAPARAKDGSWIVPLLRSVETVTGLLSFPVEVILLGESSEWHRRETRELRLPTIDAPIAVSRLTLHLPPGYRSRKQPGDGDVVAAFTRGEGITYGLGVGEVGAAQADAVFQDAVQAWMRNDFSGAQDKLDALRGMGAKNENIARLQSNLDVVAGKSSGSQDMSLQRRVREQAKARAYADVQAQAALKKQAEEERARGDYAASASSYQQALAVGDKLAQLEQAESVEQKTTNAALAEEFRAVQTKSSAVKPRRRARKVGGKAQTSAGSSVHDFDDDAVAGSFTTPTGGTAAAGQPSRVAKVPVGGEGGFESPADFGRDGLVDEAPAYGESDEASAGDVAVGRVGAEQDLETPAEPSVTPPQPAPPPDVAETRVPREPMPIDPVADTQRTLTAAPGVVRDYAEVVVVQRRASAKERVASGRARRAERKQTLDTKFKAEAPKRDEADSKDSPNLGGMPTPEVHASALSVVVPAVGEAVRYQRLLLPAGAAYAVEISAKEPLIAKE
ncbi:hypothetical protein [Nannocystis pusilla]|uniref:hypothetical protein n=1 Tax=Nannocystis pusilla TaxID=889268 RepID=UPI0023EEBFE1|nr:hypothetical protein [Nannocystis pusilla]